MTGSKLSRRDRRLFGWGAAGALLLALSLAAVAMLQAPAPERPSAPVLRPTVPAPSVAAARPGTPQTESQRPAKVQERPVEPSGSVVPDQPVKLDPPFVIVDGLTFAAGLNTYRLDNLTGPKANAACRGDDGNLWACGLQARAALNNVIQRATLLCRLSRINGDGTMQVLCAAGGVDVGAQLTAQGWARPAPGSSDAYGAEARAAEQERRGLWNGRWTFSSPG